MAEDLTHSAGPLGDTAAEPAVPPASPPGYELIDAIGHGGMGVVYRARDVALDRDVAVKLLSQRYPADSLPAKRFLSEARITGQLQHPGIPAVHQVGALADGRPFLAMKLIKGSTLEAILKQRPSPLPLSPAAGERGRGEGVADRGRLLAIFEAVCQAVGYAHAHRVIHRDLKPANVMVGAFGEVQVMDWGLAKVLGEETPATAEALAAEQTRAWTQIGSTPEDGSHTQAGSLVGTTAFIPPEQAVGEIERVNERSDVFGLGALLAVILTGKPPYVGENFESVRVQAVRGKLDDCFARLDGCGAEPELVALCKKCLAFEPADRPTDAGAVAAAVAGLRAAADERARRAELDKVRVEGEKTAAEARSLERRKRRRLAVAAAAVLAVAAVGGLSAVLAVQRRANADLAAKNHELEDEQAKVQARFELALKAIALFHTGVSEDMLLKNAEFEGLRTKLLKEAAGFYADLEKLLAGQTDAKSQKALAAAYFQLGELTDKIGDKKEALSIHRKALALRRELAAAEGADIETRLDVARSLDTVGELLRALGDYAGALTAFEEQRDLAQRLEVEHPTDAVRSALGQGHHGVGLVFSETGKPEAALESHGKTLAIRQKLAAADPAATEFQRGLAQSHHTIGWLLIQMGKPDAALTESRKALAIRQKLADANPAVTQFQRGLVQSQHSTAWMLSNQMGKPEEALTESRKALAISQKLADANPAVNEFQRELANSHHGIADALSRTGKPEEALTEYRKALAIWQKQADANPAVNEFQRSLAWSHGSIGLMLSQTGKPEEALTEWRQELAIFQKLADANPAVPGFQGDLAWSHDRIANVLRQTGKLEEALTEYRRALAIFQKLADANPADTRTQGDLAWSHVRIGNVLSQTGKPEEALTEYRKALAIWQKLADANPAVTQFQSDLAMIHNIIVSALREMGKLEEALKYLEERLQLLKAKHGPDHPATLAALGGISLGYLAVAAQQAWLGQVQEWAATCERGLSLAQDTKIVALADRVAKMCSLRPSNDKRRRAALLLARRAVELGKGNRFLPYFQMALGMAEYRSGHFADADAALLAAMEAGKDNPHIAGTSAFYRALSLFRQGKPDEARQLATQAAAKMKPPPKDAKNPLPGGGDHDDLILWLAYREAKEAIEFDEKSGAGAEPETRNKAKAAKKEAVSK